MSESGKNKVVPCKKDGGIKILHLIDSGGLYGAEKMLLALADGQIKNGDQPIILSAGVQNDGPKPLEETAENQGIPIKRWRMKPGVNLTESWNILQWAKGEGVDVLHSHGYKFNILIGIFPNLVRKIPLVTTVHGYTAAKPYSAMWFYQLVDQWLVNKMQKVVFVSKVTEKLGCFSGLTGNQKTVIYNGIMEEGDQLLYKSKNWSKFLEGTSKENSDVLLAVGRLSPEKGLFVLLDAFSQLSKENERLKLVLFGEGPLRAALEEKIVALDIQSKVALPGYVDDIESWMACSACLAMPSFSEGMPITLLEAIRCGVRVVASNVGGIPELLSGNKKATLVRSGDVTELADAIKTALEVPRNDDTLDVSLYQEFTKNHMVSRYSALYRDMLFAQQR